MKIGVFGAGAIGCFLGLRLSSVGVPITLLGRPSLVEARSDLLARGVDGTVYRPGADLVVTTDPGALAEVDLCLVTVKSRDTDEAARTLADILAPNALVVSFQNGLRNPERLRAHLQQPVVPGMVSYNVLREAATAFRQATRGPLVTGPGDGEAATAMRELANALRRAGDEVRLRDDVFDVMAGKLLLNLNNAVCAATGMSISESLRSRAARWCFSRLMREGLHVMKAAGLHPTSVVGIPPLLIAYLLRMPNVLVLRVAKSLVSIDPRAKSSTLQDLERGKPTEIDDLSGEIVRLAEQAAIAAPANEILVDAIHTLEHASPPLPYWTAEQLQQRLRKV